MILKNNFTVAVNYIKIYRIKMNALAKSTDDTNAPIDFNTIICIPGNWENESEAKMAIVEACNGEYIPAGGIMINAKKNHHFFFEVCERDEKMKRSFEVTGMVTRVTEEFLEEIEDHNLVIYLSGAGGSLLTAEQFAFAGATILKAGGIGIKVETAGKAFEKETWLKLVKDFHEHHVYEMFVIDSICEEDGTVFSCGMQNLGLKDTIVSGLPFQEAVDLISAFGYYQVIDKPTISSNETFSPTTESPIYRITEEMNAPYKDAELLGNPFGVWRLTKK